jgi:hypothetical protein
MLFLLPPSESKTQGGQPLSLEFVALTFGGMEPAREVVYEQLLKYSRGSAAKKTLSEAQRQQNLEFLTAPLMPAIDRYSGTLYDALHGRGLKGTPTEHNTLNERERQRAGESVFIQSALFGLIPSGNLIPNYRMSAGTKLPGLDLKKHWSAAHEVVWKRLEGNRIIDLRSKAYAELAPVPAEFDCLTVDVLDGKSGKALNHFNKKSKGQFVRAYLQGAETLEAMAQDAGLRIDIAGNALNLFTE